MSTPDHVHPSPKKPAPPSRVSKKERIMALYIAGITDIHTIQSLTHASTSYIASVLQEAQQLTSYFDLYTSTQKPMNTYSAYFAGKLHFRDEAAAKESIEIIDKKYEEFAVNKDRAGQHHALLMALVMMNRARWSAKAEEAKYFRDWLVRRLLEEGDEETLSIKNP